MSQDTTEVTRVVNLYIDGAGNGNADQLNEAFHKSARWFGSMDGVDYDMDKDLCAVGRRPRVHLYIRTRE